MVAKMVLSDAQISDWAKAAGLHIATNFDREMFRRFAEVVMKDVIHEDEDKDEGVAVTRYTKKASKE